MNQRVSGTLVRNYMTDKMVTVSQGLSMLEIANVMAKSNISSVALTDERDRISGILTERDIVRAVANGSAPNKTQASSVMWPTLISISDQAHIEDAAKVMIKNGVRHLLVSDRLNQLIVGIITATDLARYLKDSMGEDETVASEVWQLFF